MKKILVLGGTQFIGRNLVERLQGMAEYDITLFNRQKTQSDLFPEIKRIKGDRKTDDIKLISSEHWDFIIDLSCYYPDDLTRVLKCINKDLEKYIFISTVSVYDNEATKSQLKDEGAKILSCNDKQRTQKHSITYGNRKAECERILLNSGLPNIILRPSLVFGKYDYTDRLYYWLFQVKQDNTLLLPEGGKRKLSITYIHDLVEVIFLSLTLNSPHNVYNVISYSQASIGQIVNLAGELLDKDVKAVSVPVEFLSENDISQWTDIPLWLDSDNFTFCNQKLLDDFELEIPEFKKAIQSTIAYYNSLDWPVPKSGISEKLKTELISKTR